MLLIHFMRFEHGVVQKSVPIENDFYVRVVFFQLLRFFFNALFGIPKLLNGMSFFKAYEIGF